MKPAPTRCTCLSVFIIAAVCSLVMCLAACAVGPKYKGPVVDVPPTYRGLTLEQTARNDLSSIGDEKWWSVFQDKVLQDLIRTALAKNYDIRIAASRSSASSGPAWHHPCGPVPIGQCRRQHHQPGQSHDWADPLVSDYARPGKRFRLMDSRLLGQIPSSDRSGQGRAAFKSLGSAGGGFHLVTSAANSYFQIRALDLQLEIAQQALASRKESLQLTRTLEEHGFDTLLDVRQAEQLVYAAAAQVPDLERQIEQQENALSILLGNNPGTIPRGLKLTEQLHPPEVPVGLPSALLERRPDIREAEEKLIAANARIGVAKAAYFPQISLTGSAGYESTALASLFTGPAGIWSFGGTLTQPIFQGGRLKSNVRLAEAQHQESLLTYQQTIQAAFRDVSNALVAYRKNREFRVQEDT